MNNLLTDLADQTHQSKQVASYAGSRADVLSVVSRSDTVLDVGCNEGSLARGIQAKFPGTKVWGMDINATSLAVAEEALEAAFCINLDQQQELEKCLSGLKFDTIVAADVLEHTVNPWRIFEYLKSRLNDSGEIILSVPNFGHWETLLHLLLQRFPRRSRGLYDDTHLRFFLKGNLNEFEPQGMSLEIVKRNFRCYEKRPIRADKILIPIVRLIPWLREYFVFQWIVRIRKKSDD